MPSSCLVSRSKKNGWLPMTLSPGARACGPQRVESAAHERTLEHRLRLAPLRAESPRSVGAVRRFMSGEQSKRNGRLPMNLPVHEGGLAAKRHKGHKTKTLFLCPLCLFVAIPALGSYLDTGHGSWSVGRSKRNGGLPMNLLSGGVLAGPAPYWVGSSANGARALSPAQRAGLTIEPFVPRPEGTRFRDGPPQFGCDPFVARITVPPRRHRIEFAERHAWDRISNQTLGRGPTGRWTHDSLVNPARWAGLRDRAPLALGRMRKHFRHSMNQRHHAGRIPDPHANESPQPTSSWLVSRSKRNGWLPINLSSGARACGPQRVESAAHERTLEHRLRLAPLRAFSLMPFGNSVNSVDS